MLLHDDMEKFFIPRPKSSWPVSRHREYIESVASEFICQLFVSQPDHHKHMFAMLMAKEIAANPAVDRRRQLNEETI